jgi:hypothetical protein
VNVSKRKGYPTSTSRNYISSQAQQQGISAAVTAGAATADVTTAGAATADAAAAGSTMQQRQAQQYSN